MNQATWDQAELSVGQLAARSGVAVSALHFYERQELIISRRTTGNQRRYRRDMLRRIALIRIAQRAGVPLAEVREVLALLPDGRTPTRQDWERISRTWRAQLDERIHHLQQLRDDFTDCVGCGCLSIDRCRLANPRDELSREGAGPRRLVDCSSPAACDSAAAAPSASGVDGGGSCGTASGVDGGGSCGTAACCPDASWPGRADPYARTGKCRRPRIVIVRRRSSRPDCRRPGIRPVSARNAIAPSSRASGEPRL